MLNHVTVESGISQFRINDTNSPNAPSYLVYGQSELELDANLETDVQKATQERSTFDEVKQLSAGDVVLGLLSGTAAIVSNQHDGYMYTQNFLKLIPDNQIDAKYLVYLLNESEDIRRQIFNSSQGSAVIKLSANQIKNLQLRKLPLLEQQRIIGQVYFKQTKLKALKKSKLELEQKLVLRQLEMVTEQM